MDQRVTYHFMWGPMRHKPCLTGRAAERLSELIEERARDLEVELQSLRILPDRVYVAVTAPPVLSPHRIVCQFKAHSSRFLRHEFQEMTRIPTVWTRSYLVLAGEDIPLERVLAAFERQQPPKRKPGRPKSSYRI